MMKIIENRIRHWMEKCRGKALPYPAQKRISQNLRVYSFTLLTFFFLLLALIFNLTDADAAGWYRRQWKYRKVITIDERQVAGSSNLTNFPVLINITDTDLRDTSNSGKVAQSDGGDILFTSSDGTTKLDHEIESYTNTSGALIAWVEVPTLDYNDDTEIYIYYGNSTGSLDESNPTGVWDANYIMVNHMAEDPTISTDGDCGGGSDELCDSTSNDNDLNAANGTQTGDSVSAKIGKGIDFDGADNDYFTLSNFDPPHTGTYSFWAKKTSLGKYRIIGGHNDYEVLFSSSPDDYIVNNLFANDPDLLNGTASTDITNYRYYVLTYDYASTKDIEIYDQGGLDVSNGTWADTDPGGPFTLYFGFRSGASTAETLNGTLDEIRISNIVRSSDWIKTEYNNQNANSSSADWYDTDWGYRKKITVDNTKVSGSSNLTNFPMLVSLTDLDLRDTSNNGKVGQSDGGDILFTSSNGTTKLDHEIESYTDSTGALVAWVEIPTLDYNDDTEIYMYYGNEQGVADQANPTGTWDSNYKGVWHLHDDFLDSTSNSHDGTNNSSTDISGKMGDGQDFSGSSQWITISDHADFDGDNGITIEGWVYNEDSGGEWRGVIVKGRDNATISYWYGIFRDSAATGKWHFRSGNTTTTGSNAVTGSWVHLAVTIVQGGAGVFYLNGSSDATLTSSSGEPTNGAEDIYIGRAYNAAEYFDGRIDEVRWSNTVRSADWIATEYNNQNSPSTFYSLSGEENPPFLSVGTEERARRVLSLRNSNLPWMGFFADKYNIRNSNMDAFKIFH